MSDIDARDFGKLEAQVEALEKEVHALRTDVRVLLEEYLNSSIGPHLNTTFHRKYSTRLRCGTNIGINRITYKR